MIARTCHCIFSWASWTRWYPLACFMFWPSPPCILYHLNNVWCGGTLSVNVFFFSSVTSAEKKKITAVRRKDPHKTFFFFELLLINYPLASTVFCTYVKCAIRKSTRKQLTLGDPYASVVVVCGMFTVYFDPVSVHATNDIPSRDPSVNYQSRQQISPRPPADMPLFLVPFIFPAAR